jgi:hypothetical protein
MVWDDNGSGAGSNFALWAAVPEDPNYVALGGFFVRSYDKPTIDQTRGMKTIRSDLVTKVMPGREVWVDQGTGATMNGAVWNISTVGNLKALDAGGFIPVQGYQNPPEDVFAIDRSKINFEVYLRPSDQ